jgi:hypothetical protein
MERKFKSKMKENEEKDKRGYHKHDSKRQAGPKETMKEMAS